MVSMSDHQQQQQDVIDNNTSILSSTSDHQQQLATTTHSIICRSNHSHHHAKMTVPETEHAGEDRQWSPGGRLQQGGDRDHPQTSRDHPQTPTDTETQPLETRRKTSSPLRCRHVEQLSPVLLPSDCERKFERKQLQPNQVSKPNAQFHKLFKELSKDEFLKQSYTCALQKDILYQGRMFVSDNWICFHSKVFGRDTKIAIPVRSVTLIKKTKTAILVPNALVISTTCERHVFVSFLSRDTTYKLLKSICGHLDGSNPESCSLTVSSCDNSFGETCHSSLPLDLGDLDGVVHQRQRDLMESSSSGSMTPPYDFAGLQDQFLHTLKNTEMSVHAEVHLHSPNPTGPVKTTHKDKSAQTMSLHTILLIYLFLVSVLLVSSCYMAFKIVALEQRLNSLVSMGESVVKHRSQADFSAQMYGELSSNLFTLEKVQRNLRRLLGET